MYFIIADITHNLAALHHMAKGYALYAEEIKEFVQIFFFFEC